MVATVEQLTTRARLRWHKLKRALHPMPLRARNDYATHVPVLIGLAAMRRVERVLEFGCGNYSTRTFLNRDAFPDLKELQSVENDRTWAEQMRSAVCDDARCVVSFVDGAISEAVKRFDLESFDLILIDDSKNAAERAATIRAVFDAGIERPWVVVHDYEVFDYQNAAAAFKHRRTFKAYNPHTGVVFNSTPQNDLKTLDKLIRTNCARLDPDDHAGWLQVLRK
jgi:predicted O-methyltransferase YrrM